LDTEYDFIIAGAGCAGLSLAIHMIHSGAFTHKKILIVDRDVKKSNDRTWCFWEKEPGLFEEVVFKSWDNIWFYGEDFSNEISIAPYKYKMIRGIDFYEYCLRIIKQQKNFTFWNGEVSHVFSTSRATGVVIKGKAILCGHLFNSIIFSRPVPKKNEIWLLQHFKGWSIEAGADVFDPANATLMDFRISQKKGTAFCYVLPFSKRKALVEYTLFTPALLQPEEYDSALMNYLEQVLKIKDYEIVDEEFGVIPMTNHSFSKGVKNLVNIGTAGGQTKGSSGYTFNFIQKHSAHLVHQLINNKKLHRKVLADKYRFYDNVLLQILNYNILPGKLVFTDLFKHNPADKILKFLDNETSLKEELKIISTLPTMPFFKAALKAL
jgi:lycopene beta-cyclase